MAAGERQVDNIIKQVWSTAVRQSPMSMLKLRPDFEFSRLRRLIEDCLAKGLSEQETRDHALNELLEAIRFYSQASTSCAQAAQRA